MTSIREAPQESADHNDDPYMIRERLKDVSDQKRQVSKPSTNFHLQTAGGLSLSLHRITVAKLNDITLTYLEDKSFSGNKKMQSRNEQGAASVGKSKNQKL